MIERFKKITGFYMRAKLPILQLFCAHKCKLNRHCTVLKYYYNKIKHNLPSLSFKLMTKDRRPSALSPGKIIAAAHNEATEQQSLLIGSRVGRMNLIPLFRIRLKSARNKLFSAMSKVYHKFPAVKDIWLQS